MGETAYAKCGDLSLAYQLFGEGSVNLVVAGSFVSHVELMWGTPEIKAFFDRLAVFARVLVFDKAGVGLSDPVAKVPSLEERAEELEAVMDAAGFQSAVLVGLSEGGPAAIFFAASRPERVSALVLMGTYPTFPIEDWSDLSRSFATLRQEIGTELGDQYAPTDQQIQRFVAGALAARDEWGTGASLSHFLPSLRKQQLGMLERMSASPGMARATFEANFRLNVCSVLPTISVPTLVVHAKDDFVPVQLGRYLAHHIPGARMLEVEGRDHAPWLTDPDRILAAVERFVTGTHRAVPSKRALRTVVFTDIVGSTERAAAEGDERWRALLDRFYDDARSTVERFDGQIVKSTGDGHMVTFDGPAQAIRCAQAMGSDADALGIPIRSGVHTGECELMGDDIGGLAVHIAARVMGLAEGGEILVSRTVRDLVVGSGIAFVDRGIHELKGLSDAWQLLAVRSEGLPAGSAESALVGQATPSPRTTMRRSDRLVLRVARYAPSVLRAMARLTEPRERGKDL